MKYNCIHNYTFVALTLLISVALPARAFTFDSGNERWTQAGFYMDEGITPYDYDYLFKLATWLPERLYMSIDGWGGGPLGSTSGLLHKDLVSPDLSASCDWQNISKFTFQLRESSYTYRGQTYGGLPYPVYIQAYLKIYDHDQNNEYYVTDGKQYVPGINWETHDFDISSLPMSLPVRKTIMTVRLKVFSHISQMGLDPYASNEDDVIQGGIEIDNIVPSGGKCQTWARTSNKTVTTIRDLTINPAIFNYYGR